MRVEHENYKLPIIRRSVPRLKYIVSKAEIVNRMSALRQAVSINHPANSSTDMSLLSFLQGRLGTPSAEVYVLLLSFLSIFYYAIDLLGWYPIVPVRVQGQMRTCKIPFITRL